MNDLLLLSEKVNQLRITVMEDYESSASLLVGLRKEYDRIKCFFRPMKEAAHKTHKLITTTEKKELDYVDTLLGIVKDRRLEYKTEQDRIEREEQARLEREAREKAEAEREKLLNEAVDAPEEVQEEILKKAEDVYTAPVFAPERVAKTTEIEGGGKTTWLTDIQVEVTGVHQICKHVIEGKLPASVIEVKTQALKRYIKEFEIKELSGVRITEVQRERVNV